MISTDICVAVPPSASSINSQKRRGAQPPKGFLHLPQWVSLAGV